MKGEEDNFCKMNPPNSNQICCLTFADAVKNTITR